MQLIKGSGSSSFASGGRIPKDSKKEQAAEMLSACACVGERWVNTRWQAQADEHTGAEFTGERQFRLSGPSAHGGNGFLDDFSGENLPPCPTHTGARICGERQGGTHLSNHFHWRKRSKYMLSRYSRKGPPLRYSWTDLLGGKHRQKHSRSWSQADGQSRAQPGNATASSTFRLWKCRHTGARDPSI